MPDNRRVWSRGGTYFFTVNLLHRQEFKEGRFSLIDSRIGWYKGLANPTYLSHWEKIMEKYYGPEDIYKKLVENRPENEEWLLGLVAFAVVEEQKIEWMKHQKENTGQFPSIKDIEDWYQQQPSGVLLRARDTAETRLTDYAKDAIDTYMLDFQKETEEGIIVEEIRGIKKFWPQFGVNLAGGFASALLFAALLTLVAFFVFNDSSPVDIGAKLGQKMEVK